MIYTRLLGLVTLGFIFIFLACSNTRTISKQSPMEQLKSALTNGTNYKAEGLTFEGDLDFNSLFENTQGHSIYIDSEIRLTNCTFTGTINWGKQQGRRLYFNREVHFESCTFEQNFILNDAVFRALFQLGNNLFKKSLDLQRNLFFTNCRIDENEYGQDLILQYSRFQDDLSLFDNNVGNHILLQSISVRGNTQLSNTRLNGSLDMSNSFLHQDFIMDYVKGGKKVLLGNSKFNGRCQIRQIEGFDMVDLSGCRMMGPYHFSSKEGALEPDTTDVRFMF